MGHLRKQKEVLRECKLKMQKMHAAAALERKSDLSNKFRNVASSLTGKQKVPGIASVVCAKQAAARLGAEKVPGAEKVLGADENPVNLSGSMTPREFLTQSTFGLFKNKDTYVIAPPAEELIKF